jgi:redox-sensitive bicupin YhaK (pirin superfamily)
MLGVALQSVASGQDVHELSGSSNLLLNRLGEMLASFRVDSNDHRDNDRAGFPWHPHRGIETITYVLAGTVEHQDSLGNRGALGPAMCSG